MIIGIDSHRGWDPRLLPWGLLAMLPLLLLLSFGPSGCKSPPPASLSEQAEAAYGRGAYGQADQLFRQMSLESPASGPALHGRARVAVALRDPETALRFYGKLSRLDRQYFVATTRDDYALALLAAGRARLASGELAGALQALRVLQRVKPQQRGFADTLSRTLTAQGEKLAMHGKRSEAMKHFREAIELTPQTPAPYVGAAEILLATGRKKEALTLLGAGRRHSPADGRLRALAVEAMGIY